MVKEVKDKMTRPYSDKFIELINNPLTEQSMGIEFAKLCVEANIPALYVAHAVEASRLSVHKWFRGQDIRKKNRRIIQVFMEHLRADLGRKILPAMNRREAKQYIIDLTGVPF